MDLSIITDLEAERDALRAKVESLTLERNNLIDLAAALRAEVERLNRKIIKLSLESIKLIEQRDNIKTDLAAAVEALQKIKSMPYAVYGADEIRISEEIIHIVSEAIRRVE